MSIWFTQRGRHGQTSRTSASVPFSLILMLIGFAVFGLMSLLGRL